MMLEQATTVVRLLEEGDEVLNLWPEARGYRIAVKNKLGEVYVTSVLLDEKGIPRVERSANLLITFHGGSENEVEGSLTTPQGKVKVTSF